MRSETIHAINNASIAKRLVAAMLDFILAFFIWFVLCMFVTTPIANSALKYSDTMSLALTYQTSSHLYLYEQANDDGTYQIIEVKDYTEKIDVNKDSQITYLADKTELVLDFYLEHIYYYYTSFLTGENVVMPTSSESHTYDMVKDHFVSPDYLDKVKDSELLPKDYYTNKYFNEEILKINGDGKSYFETSDINVLAVIKDGVDEASCRTYLRNLANNAGGDLYYRSFYQDINNTLKANQLFIILPPYFLTVLSLYLLVPMLNKNGETFAKKFCHLAVISNDGYKAKKRQILFRYIVFILWVTLFLFILGIGITSFATLGLGLLIMLIVTLISKSHRSPCDYASYTIEIDAIKSVWFADANEEAIHEEELARKLDKYKSVVIENKNVIQVGDKIVDEQLKNHIEEIAKEENKNLEDKNNK